MSHAATIEVGVANELQRNAVLDIILQSYSEYEAESDPSFWAMYQQSIKKVVLEDTSIAPIVAREGDKIVGAALYCPPYERLMNGGKTVKNPYPEMRLLGVPAQMRNRGIANLLIEFCEQRARQDGFDKMTLHTTRLMQTAKQMYERRGYERYEEIDFEPVPHFHVWGYWRSL